MENRREMDEWMELLMVQKSSQPPVVYEKPVMKHGIFTISTADRRISEASTDMDGEMGKKG